MLNKKIALEKRLAELLGWTEGSERTAAGERIWNTPEGTEGLANWTRDDAAALKLLCTHGLSIEWLPDGVSVDERDVGRFASYTDHTSPDDALRCAIVETSIAQLEAKLTLESREKGYRPSTISPETLLSTELIQKLETLHGNFAKFEDGLQSHPWSKIRLEVADVLNTYKETRSFKLKFFPDVASVNPTEQLIAQLNRFNNYWMEYERAPAGSTSAYTNAREDLDYILIVFNEVRTAVTAEARATTNSKTSPGMG